MRNGSDISGRRPAFLVVLLWLGAAAILVSFAKEPSPGLQPGREPYLPDTCRSSEAEIRLGRLFPEQYRASTAVIVFQRAAGLTAEDRQRIAQLVDWIHHPVLPPDVPPERVEVLRRDLAGAPILGTITEPLLAGRLNSRDGTTTLLLVSLPDVFTGIRTQWAVEALAGHLKSMDLGGLAAEVTGNAGFYQNYTAAAQQSVDRSSVVAVGLVIVILLLIYRSPVAMLVPILTISLAVVVAMYLLYVLAPLGFAADPVVRMFVVVVLFGAGTDYCLFIIARYKEELQGGRSRREAMGATLRATRGVIIAAAATTICGLSLMALAQFLPMKKAGPSVAVALAVSCLAALTLAPALYLLAGNLIFWPPPRRKPAQGQPFATAPMAGLWERLSKFVVRWPFTVSLLTVAVLAVPSFYGFRAEPTHDVFGELSAHWSSVKGFNILKDKYTPGTMGPITILIEGQESFESGAGWTFLGQLSDALMKSGLVAEVVTPLQPLGPALPRLISLEQLPAGPIRDKVAGYFFAAGGRAARLEVLLNRGPYEDRSIAAARQIEQIAERQKAGAPFVTRVMLAGASMGIADLKDLSDRDYRVIVLAVLAAIYLILLVVLRRPILGLFLVLGTVLSFLAALGLADIVFGRLFGAPGLDWKVHFFLFVLLVAVGVDYTIYLCTRILQESAGHTAEEAIHTAMARTGGVISAAGVIVAGTFASMIAGTLSLTIELGLSLAVGILIDTFLVRPLFVPAVSLILSRLSAHWFRRFEL